MTAYLPPRVRRVLWGLACSNHAGFVNRDTLHMSLVTTARPLLVSLGDALFDGRLPLRTGLGRELRRGLRCESHNGKPCQQDEGPLACSHESSPCCDVTDDAVTALEIVIANMHE